MTDHNPDEGATSQVERVYLRVSPALDALDLNGASMRGISIPHTVGRLCSLQHELTTLGSALASYFHEAYLARWREAVEALPDLLDVLFYTDAMTQLARARPLDSAERFTHALAALRADRAAGMTALTMLHTLHIVGDQLVSHIKRGTGHLDLINDCLTLGLLIEQHWSLLAPLCALQQDPSLLITPQRITRLKDASSLLPLLAARHTPNPGLDWPRQRLATRVLLGQQWDIARAPARFHFEQLGHHPRAARYASIVGLRSGAR
jgi:hypothetical protein